MMKNHLLSMMNNTKIKIFSSGIVIYFILILVFYFILLWIPKSGLLPSHLSPVEEVTDNETRLRELHDFVAFYEYQGFFEAFSVLLIGAGFAGSWIFYLLQETKDYNFKEGEFLTSLGNQYIQNEDFEYIYNLCDKAFSLRKYRPKSADDKTLDNIELQLRALCRDKYALVSNYLSFFEIFIVLCNQDIIKIDSFDDLFGYRFLLVARNSIIREYTMEHAQRRGYFHNIIKLEELWLKYREIKFRTNGEIDPFKDTYFDLDKRNCESDEDIALAFQMRNNVVESNRLNGKQEQLLIDRGIDTVEEFSQFFQLNNKYGAFVRGIYKIDKLVAYIIVSFRPEPLNHYFKNDDKIGFQKSNINCAYIELVLVDNSFQGRNYQKALLIDVQNYLKEKKKDVAYIGAIVSPRNNASYISFIEEGYIVNNPCLIHEPEKYERIAVLKKIEK